MTTPSKQVAQQFGEIAKLIRSDPLGPSDLERICTIADKILRLDPNQIDAIRTKLVALIKLDKYNDALDFLKIAQKNASQSLFSETGFEHAYCLYRTNAFEESLTLVNKYLQLLDGYQDGVLKTSSLYLNLLHLKTQVLYRLEQFESCLHDGYENLIAVSPDLKEDEDIKTNVSAVKASYAAMMPSSAGKDAVGLTKDAETISDQSSYETLFNKACILLSLQNLPAAERLLKKAQRKCREQFMDDGADTLDMEVELAAIAGQLAYIYQLQGKTQEAMGQYRAILQLSGVDLDIAAIAENNLVACRGRRDLFESTKGIKFAQSDSVFKKLNSVQRKIVQVNDILLSSVMSKKSDVAEKKWNEFKTLFPNDPYSVLLESVVKQKKQRQSIGDVTAQFEEYAKTFRSDIVIQLTLTQLYLSNSQWNKAINKLDEMVQVGSWPQYIPGFVSILSWLYAKINSPQEALHVLEKVFSSQKKNPVVLKQLGSFKYKLGRFEEAATDYEAVLGLQPEDRESIAGLVLAYSESNPQKALSLLNDLSKSVIGQTKNFSVEELDALEREIQSVRLNTRLSTQEGKSTEQVPQHAPKKRKRQRPVPKNFDPNATPDPERWLPKHLRSSYAANQANQKGPKSKKDLGKGPQGVNLENGGIGGTGSARINLPGMAVTGGTAGTPNKGKEPAVDSSDTGSGRASPSTNNPSSGTNGNKKKNKKKGKR